jgi:hypothetical protein
VLVGQDDFEGIVTGFVKCHARQAHDDVGLDRASRDAMRDGERPAGLEQLAAIGVDQSDLEIVRALIGKVSAYAEDEYHGRVAEREFSRPDRIEDAEDVQLSFLADIRGVGYYS